MAYTGKHELIFPYEFLTNPKYRMGRLVLLIFGVAIISFNRACLFYHGHFSEMGMEKIFIPAFLIFISYAIVVYTSIYILIPKYIQSQKHGQYITLLLGLIIVCVVLQEGLQYKMSDSYNANLLSCILGLCATFVTDTICIIGISATVFLKHWLAATERIVRLEKEQIRMEVEHLKEQLNPLSLFDILNRAGNWAKKDKAKASEILMELSSILRYQLYDCNREYVFIHSEIEFIRDYLKLQKLCHPNLEYTISIHGNLNMILTPPLLFIPFIQSKLDELDNDKPCRVMIKIQVTDNALTFLCSSNNTHTPQLSKIKKRLDILYPSGYKLEFENKGIKFQLSLHHKNDDGK